MIRLIDINIFNYSVLLMNPVVYVNNYKQDLWVIDISKY